MCLSIHSYLRVHPFISVSAYVCSLMYAYVQVHPHVCLSVCVHACEYAFVCARVTPGTIEEARTPAMGRAAGRAEGAWVWDCCCACPDV